MAELYKYRGPDGSIHFTAKPMKGPYKLLWRSGNSNDLGNAKATNPSGLHRTKRASKSIVYKSQVKLLALGYNCGKPDGLEGKRTVNAVKEFQKDIGINPDGIISSSLLALLDTALDLKKDYVRNQQKEKKKSLRIISSGSGFFISSSYVLTNYHVIKNCKSILIPIANEIHRANIKEVEKELDIALIKISKSKSNHAVFSDSNLLLGQEIVVVGFPLRGILSDNMSITSGEINALSGINNNKALIQISAPTQQGNSGGPLLDRNGFVVGMVVSKLDALEVAKYTGDIPQNINFAIKGNNLRAFLEKKGISYSESNNLNKLTTEEIAISAEKYTVPVECYE